MTTKLVEPGSVKVGGYIVMNGAACKVTDVSTSKPGKHGHAKYRIVAVGLIDEKKREIVLPGHDKVEVPMIEKKSAQILHLSEDSVNVMDSETFETFDLEVPEDLKGKLSEGIQVVYWTILGEKIMKQIKGGSD
jgi:translation initiation factor 5A